MADLCLWQFICLSHKTYPVRLSLIDTFLLKSQSLNQDWASVPEELFQEEMHNS
jgi:hypothetical protein